MNMYRTLNLTTAEYVLFLGTDGQFIKVDHIPDHRASLDKFYRMKITHNYAL